ncbi:MAG: Na+/H+ antiporter subunit G [Nitrosomonadales bacterium]|nr:Na+/H+ antiporter subunit G [Nitrosomonadales bacterium]
MGTLLPVLGGLLLVTGATFLLLGGLGLVRMPDLFNRIQAGTKATTLGTLLTLAGAACLQPAWGLKLLLIGLFILFTNPLSSQVLARAAHRIGTEKSPQTMVDRLAEDTGEKP